MRVGVVPRGDLSEVLRVFVVVGRQGLARQLRGQHERGIALASSSPIFVGSVVVVVLER